MNNAGAAIRPRRPTRTARPTRDSPIPPDGSTRNKNKAVRVLALIKLEPRPGSPPPLPNLQTRGLLPWLPDFILIRCTLINFQSLQGRQPSFSFSLVKNGHFYQFWNLIISSKIQIANFQFEMKFLPWFEKKKESFTDTVIIPERAPLWSEQSNESKETLLKIS